MTKFLFVYPHREADLYAGCKHHMGAAYIRAYGRYGGKEVDTFLSSNRLIWDDTAKNICERAEIGVGFSVYNANYPIVANLATRIKSLRPDLVVVCGGPTATSSPQRILDDCPAIDICIVGEGELTFRDIYQIGFNAEALVDIPGLVLREGNGYRCTGVRSLYMNPDDRRCALHGIPSPYLNGVVPPSEAPFLGVYTTRGCNYSCTFCSFSALSRHTLREFPESQVLDELHMICRHFEVTGEQVIVPINDDNFTADLARCNRIMSELARFRPENVEFWIDSRADRMGSNDFYDLARRAGIKEINFGLESASPEVLASVRKVRRFRGKNLSRERYFIEEVRKAVEMADRHGICATVSIILGLPEDTPQRAVETVAFVKKLPLVAYSHNILNILDGTELSLTYKEFGLDRVLTRVSPFPLTKHTYNVKAQPMLSHATQVLDYRLGALTRTILAMTGMMNVYSTPDAPCIVLDSYESHERDNLSALPSGTVFLVMPGNECGGYWKAHGYLTHSLEPYGTGYVVDPDAFGEATPMPLIMFPGHENKTPCDRACIEFVEMGPSDDFPESTERHWRLPYAACGLLPAGCPAEERRLISVANKDCCAFHCLDRSPLLHVDCEICDINETCPKCPYMLDRFGDTYCEFHRRGKAWKLLGYLLAHIRVLNDRKTDWTKLPSIRCEDILIMEKETCILRMGQEFVIMRQGKLFHAPHIIGQIVELTRENSDVSRFHACSVK